MKLLRDVANQTMQQISSHSSLSSSQNQSTVRDNQKSTTDFPRWLNNIFYQFAINYNILWTNEIKTKDLETAKKLLWMSHLSVFKPESISAAVSDAILFYKSYPPKTGEFVELCKNVEKRNSGFHSIPQIAYENEQERLESQRIAQENLNKMWLSLGKTERVVSL